jgi:hypothetical protein
MRLSKGLFVGLFGLALAVPALIQPASARAHSGHHHWGAVHPHRNFAYRGFEDRQAAHDDARRGPREAAHGELDAMIAREAHANGVPEALVHRVVIRESRYNPRAVGSGGAMGLMQIKYATARAMGYGGSPSGLLDPQTNLTYAVRYLAGAYQVAGGNPDRAVSNYARGYYAGAKRQGFSPYESAGRVEGYASAGLAERSVARSWSDRNWSDRNWGDQGRRADDRRGEYRRSDNRRDRLRWQ